MVSFSEKCIHCGADKQSLRLTDSELDYPRIILELICLDCDKKSFAVFDLIFDKMANDYSDTTPTKVIGG